MESDRNKDFDRQVRKKLENFSEEVSPSLWSAIEKEIQPEKARTKVFDLRRYRYISIAAALLIIGFTVWQIRPEEKIFLNGQGTVEEIALVKEPVIKQPVVDKTNSLNVEKEKEPAITKLSNPVIETVLNDDEGKHSLQDSPLVKENKIEKNFQREPLIAVNAPLETDDVSLEEVSMAPSLNETLDVSDEYLASLNQGEGVVESEERSGIVSGILNFVAANIKIGEGKRVEFTETEHGIIKIGLKR